MVLGAMLQDSDSADEIECSSEEGAVSPASVQANKTSSARTSEQQHHARVHSVIISTMLSSCYLFARLLSI